MRDMEFKLNDRITHFPSGDVIVVTKINQKTYAGKSTQQPFAEYVRVRKEDCIAYVNK